ncbi:MAG: universal stress protein [Candidatus Latescibacteria bacterium]|nr:universal stress protein [Candidatus Latescibacterota bacterium]
MVATRTQRPRNVDAGRAAAILYGDWGTSKAYVIGLAFAVGGYSSFWLIAPMCLLTALVGLNYIVICRHYPDGGGVYASVRHRSEIISIVGAFLLIADYIVTAAISALSAFQYLGVAHPEVFAGAAIAVIGAANYFGPKHTGGLALLISLPTVVVVVVLGVFCVPHLGEAVFSLQPLHGGFLDNWNGFVGIVLALSGVEAIANATGVMKLNPDSKATRPSVSRTSTPAIVAVMLEVCVFTALFGLAMHALGGLQISNGDVNAPGREGVRDYLLRYLAEVFIGGSLGPLAGQLAGWAVSVVFGLLLLSAVNTAIVDLIAIQFLMSRDGEVPQSFQRLNGFGVPTLGMVLATIVPLSLVLLVKDMAGLANLYAVGVVGAIATNLGATSTDQKLPLTSRERTLMFCTFLVMLAIEISLLFDKPDARAFAFTVLAVGLILRGLASERAQKKARTQLADAAAAEPSPVPARLAAPHAGTPELPSCQPLLCAVRGVGRTLDFAIDEARESGRPLHLLFVREQQVLAEGDQSRRWQDDAEACEIFRYAKRTLGNLPLTPCYAVSDSPAKTIVDVAATLGASHLILGVPRRSALLTFLRGNIIRQVCKTLPEEIHLLVYA